MQLHLALLALFPVANAENGLKGWLRYAAIPDAGDYATSVPKSIIALNSSETSPVYIGGLEIQKGLRSILNTETSINPGDKEQSASIVIGTVTQYKEAYGDLGSDPGLDEDGFWLNISDDGVKIIGRNERGALYGAFEYLSRLGQGNLSNVTFTANPHAPIRWVNQWDNMGGTIEQGFAGPSIFFQDGAIVKNLTRVAEYARLLASIRINGIIVNNVNANASLLSAENMDGLKRIADVFRPYGIQMGISLNFASPQTFGGLSTFDPLDPSVVSWWTNITEQLYKRIPDMAGYLVKANSEGQPGPLTYNRTLADGANLFAKALQPHGGIVMFRAFVYNNKLDESDWYADRANAAVDFFKDLDGLFDDNVVVQIKYGPIDFQVREPPSPLFANIPNTNTAIELQVTQEYLGQQCHLVYIPPLWKTILDFDMRVDNQSSKVSDILSGKRFKRPLGGSAGVVNVGTNTTWLGSHLALSNLYAYGRLAWDPSGDPESIVQDWIRLTFGQDQKVLDTVTKMSMESWPAYENYTGNLGIQTLTDILYTHFGPNPASMDNNGWGQWTRADRNGIGMDRTVANGTKFAGQYPPEVAKEFESIETTPDDLLLWFHHVNYTHILKSGKTVIQHFYDAHYAGAETAQTFVPLWESLEGRIDDERFKDVLFRLKFQAGHSIIWRDAINGFYSNLSSIKDESNRVGNHRWRVEAENMVLAGYKKTAVTPFETASSGTAIITSSNGVPGSASIKLDFPSGTYDLAINYYDVIGGKARWEAFLNGESVGKWVGDNEDKLGHVPSTRLDGHSATRITFSGINIETGDELKIVGTPDGIEPAPLDYIALLPPGVVD